MISCRKSSTQTESLDISLIAPSGVQIASSMLELKGLLNPIIFDKFNDKIGYEINKIEYFNSSQGFFAIINFVLKTSEQSNVIYSKDYPSKINYDKSNVKYLSLNKRMGGYSFSCSGASCCLVHAISHPDGTVDIDCSCSGCTMSIQL